MFGYRLVRERDHDAAQAELSRLHAKVDELHGTHVALAMQLAEAKATALSRATSIDLMTVQLNTAQMESAQYRARLTGAPAIAPQIVGRGSPLGGEGIGAGADLFEDVGDERAAELIKAGQLDPPPDMVAFPAADAVAPSA